MDACPLPENVIDVWSIEAASLIADTRSSRIYRVKRRDLPTAIVKCLKPEGMEELIGLHFLDWRRGSGAVRLLDQRENICLLEDAGTLSLAAHRLAAGEAASTDIIVDVVSALHAPSDAPVPADLTPLERHFRGLFLQAESETDPTLRAFFAWSAELAAGLLQEQENVRPLHGDLHHDNIMSDGGRGWLAIDPHGVIGDPAYDVANVFGNPLGAGDAILDPQRIVFLARRFGAAMGYLPEKILRYAVAHAALSMAWSLERPDSPGDRENADERHAFAIIGRRLLAEGNL